jgi:poly(3-hydroxybutyrate) depolymerase
VRRGLVLLFALLAASVAVAAIVVWLVAPGGTAKRQTGHARLIGFTLRSDLLRRSLPQVAVEPPGGGKGRPLLVLLHGRGALPDSFLSDAFFDAVESLGDRAPGILLANGGDSSYWHDRRDGRWGSYVLREAIPAAIQLLHSDRKRVAIGGISMGGFGALNLARIAPERFCAVGGHSAALWVRAAETPAGAFDDAQDFARNDVIRFARARSPYRTPVWIDVGTDDPFRSADGLLAQELRAQGAPLVFHVWPGGHEASYWDAHMSSYLRFYADACR